MAANPAVVELSGVGVQVVLPEAHGGPGFPKRPGARLTPGRLARPPIRLRLVQQVETLEALPQAGVVHLTGGLQPRQQPFLLDGRHPQRYLDDERVAPGPSHLTSLLLLDVVLDHRQWRTTYRGHEIGVGPRRGQATLEPVKLLTQERRRLRPLSRLTSLGMPNWGATSHSPGINDVVVALEWNICSHTNIIPQGMDLMQGDFKRAESGPSSPRLKAWASGPRYLATGALAYLDTIGTRAEDRAYKRMRLVLEAAHRTLHNRMHQLGYYHDHTPLTDHPAHHADT